VFSFSASFGSCQMQRLRYRHIALMLFDLVVALFLLLAEAMCIYAAVFTVRPARLRRLDATFQLSH
jgi:hypothetical protein